MAAGKKKSIGPNTRPYDHKEAESLLRPDVGLQAQFKRKRLPKTYRYDSSIDPSLSWDINADRERVEALIAEIEELTEKLAGHKDDPAKLEGLLLQIKTAADALKRMSRHFLNWAGKAERTEFNVPTLPLFIHERLSTQAILETLKHRKKDKARQMELFADHDLSITDRILKAYVHKIPWVNRMILGDSLVAMNSLLEYEGLGGQVQMIYMDPPYGVKFGSNFQPFIRKRDVKHGDDEHMTREPEMVQAYRDTWELGLHSYLTYLRDRFLLARELLHPSGSIFVQIGDENVHHVRELLDEVFGAENFCGMVSFKVTGGTKKAHGLPQTTDFLIWYAKEKQKIKFRRLFLPQELDTSIFSNIEDQNGTRRPLTDEEKQNPELVKKGSRFFSTLPMHSKGTGNNKEREFNDKMWSIPEGMHWRHSDEGFSRLVQSNRVTESKSVLRSIAFFDDFPYVELTSTWNDTGPEIIKDYVVQTSELPISRCLLMTTDPGDLILDPTCGSGTTAYVAEQWGRRWITIDTSRVPLALARQRLLTATFAYYELRDPAKGPSGGFVYKRKQNKKGEEVGGIVPHITLKSIAQNQPPDEEVLVDRPEVVTSITRVSGPFVVEATIPTPIQIEEKEPGKVAEGETEYGDYINRMIEVLRHSPLLRLPGNQTVEFKNVRRPARAMDIHAEAVVANDKEKPVAFYFGPEHGPVTEQMVFAAAREAYAKSFSHLYIIGFAIQDKATRFIHSCLDVVGIPATYVQATMDLQMSDLLKTTRSSQVFSVTGAPEIRLTRTDKKAKDGSELYQVELLGLDVFDPVTCEVYHSRGDDVPAWFLDSDYNNLAFCVTQAFFPRTRAWDSLQKALKGTFEDSVWEHLSGTISEPFVAGEHGRIAVKVIDDRGNELMVVKSLDEAEIER
ncbi:MAG: DNA methylase [Nitrospinae bacterium RIFCSPLOWO2_12_FULL_45_22]|nr:MAG: DNA methylase [Nitrospinae bacterium RIFCSPLOWO2_12_FULL_45_22]